MKATELMIGDWILYGDKPVKVLQLSEKSEYDWVKPIPLTPEILWKNCESPDIVEWFPNSIQTQFHIHIEGLNVTIDGYVRYVHELQHALRQCEYNELADNFQI